MNTQLAIQGKIVTLLRYPAKSQHVSLQAWDSADEYIMNHLAEHPALSSLTKIVLNDDFGALACGLNGDLAYWYSDSKVAELALQQNWSGNFSQPPPFKILNTLSQQPEGLSVSHS